MKDVRTLSSTVYSQEVEPTDADADDVAKARGNKNLRGDSPSEMEEEQESLIDLERLLSQWSWTMVMIVDTTDRGHFRCEPIKACSTILRYHSHQPTPS